MSGSSEQPTPAPEVKEAKEAKDAKEKRGGKDKSGQKKEKEQREKKQRPPHTSPVIAPSKPKRDEPEVPSLSLVVAGDKEADIPRLLLLYTTAKAQKAKTFKPTIVSVKLDILDEALDVVRPHIVNLVLSHEGTPRTAQLVGVDAVILCYIPAKPGSLDAIRQRWLPVVRDAAPDAVVTLCGTRLDVISKAAQVVKITAALSFCAEMQLQGYFEASARNNKGVKSAVEQTLLLALKRRLAGPGAPMPLYAATEAEVKRVKKVRTEVKSAPPKSTWVQRFDERSHAYYYYNRKTGDKTRTRPPGFDGEDFEAREKEAVETIRRQYMRSREVSEQEFATDHASKMEALQRKYLEAAVVVAHLDTERATLRDEERRYAAQHREWSARLTSVQEAITREKNSRVEEELAAEEEKTERFATEEACKKAERALAVDDGAAERVGPTVFKQKEEQNAALAAALSALEAEGQEMMRKLKEAGAVLASAEAKNRRFATQIEARMQQHAEATTEAAKLREAIALNTEKRRTYQSDLVRAKDEASNLQLQEELKGQEEDRLARDIDKLEFDIMQHAPSPDTPPAEVSQRDKEALQSARDGLVQNIAAACATQLEAADRATTMKAAYISLLQQLDNSYDTHQKLGDRAASLASRVADALGRKSQCVWRSAQKMTRRIGGAETAAGRRILQRRRQKLYTLHRTLLQKAADCRVEAAGLEQRSAVRASDRLAHNAFGQQVVEYLSSLVAGAAVTAPCVPGSPPRSAALRCSDGVLFATRRHLAAAEAFVLRLRQRRQAARKREQEEESRAVRCLQRGAVEERWKNKRDGEVLSSSRLRRFAMSRDVSSAAAPDTRALMDVAVPFPASHRSLATTSRPYRDTAVKSWVSFARAMK